MTTAYLSVVVIFTVGLAVVLPTLRKLLESTSADAITAEWLANFCADSYSPMENLLSAEDFDFLSRQPGFDLALYRKLRQERLQIFHMYLHRMIADFSRLHFAARLLVAHATEDQSGILKRLLWLKLRFSVTVLRAEFSYHLCRFGVGSLPARALITRLQDMSAQIGAISIAEAA